MRFPKTMTRALASITIVLAALPAGAGETENDARSYVLLVTGEDRSIEALFERYPELEATWEELAKFNLLRSGHALEVPEEMLESEGVLAKVGGFYGEAEVKRSFDKRYIPLVDDLLLREGDQIRTWGGAGVRILFEDGNYVFLKSRSKARLVSLGSKKIPATSRLKLELMEGGLSSEMENELHGPFEVETASAVTIIRGTHFRVKVEGEAATRVEVLEGRVDLEVGDRRLSVGTQEGALARQGEDPASPVALPLPPRELLAPQAEEVIRRTEFQQRFQWTVIEEATSYRFELARDRSFFDIVTERLVGPEASVRVESLEPGTYFWRVSTILANGFEGSPSDAKYFVFVQPRP